MLYELQKIHDALTKTKDEHNINFRKTRPLERFLFSNIYQIQQNKVQSDYPFIMHYLLKTKRITNLHLG